MIYTRCILGKNFFEKSVKKRLTKGKKGDNIGTLSKKERKYDAKISYQNFFKKVEKKC